MIREENLLNEYFNYFDQIILSLDVNEYPLIQERYKIIKNEYNQLLEEVCPTNFLNTMGTILNLDAQLQIMVSLLSYSHCQFGSGQSGDNEILRCSLSDYKSYYLESFGYRINDKIPHTILHFFS
ncbi:hypothetical protein QuyetLC_24510 [Bacillus anthracis]|uniref:Uncharacterized protein n=1 Tax=Bacillus anthracis TaxID=1392 RepID=A0A640MI99_BACAN|nr:hypothetical protein QuyetLC_24510 [Bacillus anthracis]